jgi:hypothetical protein
LVSFPLVNRLVYFVGVLGLGWIALAGPLPSSAPAVIELSARAKDAATQALIDTLLNQPTTSRRKLSTELAGVADAECALREFVVSALSLGDSETVGRSIRRRATISTARINRFLADLAARDPYRLNIRSLQLSAQPVELTATGEVNADDRPFDDHPGWRHCRSQSVTASRRAAAEDLRARLLGMLEELPVSLKATLGETLAQNADAGRAVREEIDKLSLPEAILNPSGVCRIRLVIPRKQIVTQLQTAIESATGDKVAVDWPRLSSKLPASLSAEGFSVAPPSMMSARASRPAEDP